MTKRYKCPYCELRLIRKDLINHIDKKHEELIPQGYTSAQLVYNQVNKIDHGKCRVCGKLTSWNEKSGRYNVLCDNPKCKEHMREEYKKNMLRVRGTYNILNDPEQQKKMLANRSISGSYKFSDGGILTYTGSYEKKCLEFMDVVMQIPSKDILSPGPTIEYEYNGSKHFYITDFYYIPYNLIIEVKDGGDNLNNKDSSSMRASREKTIEKERIITDRGEYNYIRLTNNDFSQLLDVFMTIKEKLLEGDVSKTYKINESVINDYFIEGNIISKIKNALKIDTNTKFNIHKASISDFNKFYNNNDFFIESLFDKESDLTDEKAQIIANNIASINISIKYKTVDIYLIKNSLLNNKYDLHKSNKFNDKSYSIVFPLNLFRSNEHHYVKELFHARYFNDVIDNREYREVKMGYHKMSPQVQWLADIDNNHKINESVIFENAHSKYDIKNQVKRIAEKVKKDKKDPTGNQNCMLCTWCMEAWFRGIDILPRAVYSPTDKIFDFEGYDIIKQPTKITINDKNDIKKFILAAGDRSRFYVHFKWKNGNGGHEFLLINIRDEIYLIDAQSNILEKITSPKVSSYFRDVDYEKSFIVRVDDKEINTSMLKYNDMEPKEFTPEDMKYIHDNDLIKKEYTDIEGEISINESSESVFDKILKLNDRLNDYEYMIPNNGNPITHIKNDDFIKYYVLLSPNEFEKYKGGVCWDYVAYEAMYFRAKYPNIKFETYYQVIDNRNDNPTHTFLIFEFNKKWYWFESSWKPNCGVYGFDNKSDCIEYIMQKLKLPGKNYGTYICKFDATDATMYGMNCVGYMNYMSFMIKPYKFTNKKIEPVFIYKGHCPDDKEYTMESVIFNSKDIYYNKDKFDSGEINLCFITGFSGSGKSTMADEMEKSGIEKYELDDIVFQFNFSDENLKEYGGMISSFFNGPGKKYRAVKGIDDLKTDKEADDYQANICIDFIDYAKKYAASHKDKKFIVEGVEIFGAYIDKIESLKDYAIYIKGTSLFNSYIRSAKRDSQDAETNFGKFKSFMKMIASSSRFKQYLTANTRLNKIKKQINEYVTESKDKSELIKDFKSKTSNVQYKTLSIDKPEIYDYLKNHFSKNNPMWEGVKDSKTYMDCFINGNNSRHIKRVGEVLINKATDEVIGFEVVEKPDNYLAIEIPNKKYRGYGFGSLLLEDAIKKHGCKKLYVAKDNKIAIKMYTNRGFEKTGEFYDGEYWRMELKKSSINEACIVNVSNTFIQNYIRLFVDYIYKKYKSNVDTIDIKIVYSKQAIEMKKKKLKYINYSNDFIVINYNQIIIVDEETYGDQPINYNSFLKFHITKVLLSTYACDDNTRLINAICTYESGIYNEIGEKTSELKDAAIYAEYLNKYGPNMVVNNLIKRSHTQYPIF